MWKRRKLAPTDAQEKACSRCKAVKPLDDFSFHAKGLYGRQSACKACERERHAAYRKTHPRDTEKRRQYDVERIKKIRSDEVALAHVRSVRRRRNLKVSYGITEKKYQSMLKKQGGVCAICKNPETAIHHQTKEVMPLSVDHDHRTGKVRGLLCRRCNIYLGSLENEQMVAPFYDYLRLYGSFPQWLRRRRATS